MVNRFFAAGADQIISVMLSTNGPSHVYLDTYQLSDDQVERLADAIRGSSKLIYLNLFGCGVDEKGAAILLSALKENKTLKEIVIDHDLISDATYNSIMQAVEKNAHGDRVIASDPNP